MTHEQLALLAAAAILLAVIAGVIAVVALLRARAAVVAARACLGVAHSHGKRPPDPPRNLAVDRRERNIGPPEGFEERRGAHRAPDDTRQTRRGASAIREGDLLPFPEDAQTAEHAPPTRDMRALPPPGSITRS